MRALQITCLTQTQLHLRVEDRKSVSGVSEQHWDLLYIFSSGLIEGFTHNLRKRFLYITAVVVDMVVMNIIVLQAYLK